MRRFYKHIITVTVLSESPVYDPFDIAELAYDITEGDELGMMENHIKTIELTHDQLIEETYRLGRDPGWFLLNDD